MSTGKSSVGFLLVSIVLFSAGCLAKTAGQPGGPVDVTLRADSEVVFVLEECPDCERYLRSREFRTGKEPALVIIGSDGDAARFAGYRRMPRKVDLLVDESGEIFRYFNVGSVPRSIRAKKGPLCP